MCTTSTYVSDIFYVLVVHLSFIRVLKVILPVARGGWLSCTGTTVDRTTETAVQYNTAALTAIVPTCASMTSPYTHVHSYVYSKEILEQIDHTARLK